MYRNFAEAPIGARHVVTSVDPAEAVATAIRARVVDGSLLVDVGWPVDRSGMLAW
jgi:hypothetical protein